MKLLFCLIFMILYLSSYSQSPILPKEAFYLGLKVNKLNASNQVVYIRLTGRSPETFQWGEIYASYFDKDNYIKAFNDEFQRVPYLTQKYKELNEGIKNADLKKTFSFITTIPVGIYDAECGCFPLDKKRFLESSPWLLNVKSVGTKELTFNNSFVRFSISNYFNFNDFDFTLKINPSEAAKFIDSRKDNYGKINRDITIKVIYNIVDESMQNGDRDYYVKTYIHRLEFYNGSILLGSSLPKFNYYDKVNLVKIKNGTEKQFLDEKRQEMNNADSMSAKYYIVRNYKDGKIDKVLIYFINGSLETESEYKYSNDGDEFGYSVSYYENGLKKSKYDTYNSKFSGKYISWYSNGQKWSERNYADGKLDGQYNAWHSNGYKKEEVYYVGGEISGCDFKWNENGKCNSSYSEYYENGKYIYNSKCPCTDSKKEVQIQTKVNLENVTLLTINEVFGIYNGISESAGTTITISSDGNVEYITTEKTYKGQASVEKTEEKDYEWIQSKVPNKLKKDFEITGNTIILSMTLDDRTKKMGYILLKTKNSMILWGGGDAFFEKK